MTVDWISHVLNRVNTLTGVRYADDPTVMTWELGNEPRCKGSGSYPTSPACGTATLTAWADEMTRHLKSIDPRHLTSVGDEGFFCDDPASGDWTSNCGEGVDTVAITRLPAVDVMSFHAYPIPWGKDAAWGAGWAARHAREARSAGKAVMFGEFGLPDKSVRNPVYQQWTDAFIAAGGNGFLYWILSGSQDDGTLYPDYDGYTVYCPSPVCTTLSNAAEEIAHGQRSRPPVADHDIAVVEFNSPAVLSPTSNDIGYRTRVNPSTLDLDPAVPGRQTSVNVQGGRFVADTTGKVTYTPTAGFAGRATAPYTVRDLAGRVSNVADLVVTVKPDPTAAIVIASFESGTDGWAPGNWQANAGTLSQTTDFHTDGASGLHVSGADGGWFGSTFAEPLDLSGKTALKVDLRTGPAAGTSTDIAIQVGPASDWCQGAFVWVPENTTTTFEADLTNSFPCDPARLADVRAIWVFFNGGEFDADFVRAE